MKNVIQNLNDITDSREILEAKPHPFTVIFIYILIAMIISALVWAYFGEIDIVVTANGIVRPNEKERIIKNKIFGEVEKTNLEDGKKVQKGDILYVVNHNDLQLEKKFLDNESSKLSIENDNLLKLKKSINDSKNYFSKDIENEMDYYYKYLKYELDCENIRLQIYETESKLNENTLKKYKIDTLVAINDSLKSINNKIDEIKKSIDNVRNGIEDCIVKAPIDGIVNVIKEITNEELVESGIEIATIIPQDNSKYRIELFISNKDIAKVNEGNEIKYSFEALSYREYGQIKGKIMNIGVDSKINNSGMSYYVVESEMENKVLYSYKGEETEIKVGMTCEAQVITETKKILYYILENINLMK